MIMGKGKFIFGLITVIVCLSNGIAHAMADHTLTFAFRPWQTPTFEAFSVSITPPGTYQETHGPFHFSGQVTLSNLWAGDNIQVFLDNGPYTGDSMAGTLILTQTAGPPAPVVGDINADGKIDLADALLAMRILPSLIPLQAIYKETNINGNGEIGLPEAIYALQCTALLRRDCLTGCGCPEVILESTIPADGSMDIPVDANVTATFNKTMNASTFTENTFYVRYGDAGAFLSGTVSYGGLTARFAPMQFPYDSLLTATVTTGIKDLAGNALAANHVWRFTTRQPPRAALDATFGLDGKTTTHFEGGTAAIKALVIRPDGKIVAAGSANTGISSNDFSGNAYASGLALQSDGKIVVGGMTAGGVFLARFNTNGTPDPTFGNSGKSIGAASMAYIRRLALQADGKIVIAGSAFCYDFALARYNSNGTLDTGFGTGGMVITDFDGGNDNAEAIAVQPDGKIITAGWRLKGYYDFALARYNSDGTLDTNFGTGGKVITSFGGFVGASAKAVAVQPDGKIVAVGDGASAGIVTNRIDGFAIARYNENGSLDATFGEAGKALTNFGNPGAGGHAICIQSDGKIVSGGS